jgi:(2R)-sulfolactate sulfo-lyase subunit beta
MGRYQFLGYRRENGRVGIRNHVVILPLDDLSNAAAEAVANNIKGTLALPHAYGRLQFGEDLELHFRTLIGTGSNPNVAACVVIGIEPGWTGRIVDGIAKTGKPVAGFAIEGNGDITTIANSSRKAREFVGQRKAARNLLHRRSLCLHQVRGERHHFRPRLLPHSRQSDR